MRDALSMLDQVRAACGDATDDAAVAQALGSIDTGAVMRLASALIRRDGAAVLSEVEALYARGHDMKRLAEELVRHLRDVVVSKLVPNTPLDLPDAERREVRMQAEAAPAAQLTRLFDLVERSVGEVKLSEQPRYVLEVALLKGCFLAPGAQVEELISRLEGLSRGGASSGSEAHPERAPSGRPASAGGPAGSSSRSAAPAGAGGASSAVPRDVPGGQPERWRAAVDEVERVSSALANALKQAVLVNWSEGEVALRMPPGMFFSTVERRRSDIEALFSRFFGRPTKLSLSQGAPDPAAPSSSLAAAEQREREARWAAAKAHPNIREASRILDGEVTNIEDL